MPVVSVPTSFNISLEFDAPGLGRRSLSLFIDMLVQYLYIILVSYIMSVLYWGRDEWALWLILLSPVFLYHLIWELTSNGQSIGKKMTKLRVVSINGGRPSVSQLLIRWLLRISDLWIVILLYLLIYLMAGGGGVESVIAFMFGMGFLVADIILVANSKRAQRIGDILAQTIVIKTSAKESLHNTIFREVAEDYVLRFPEVMRISDRDLNIIKNLLNDAGRSGNQEKLAAAAEKVKAYLKIQTDMYPDEFLESLLKDYNYLSAK